MGVLVLLSPSHMCTTPVKKSIYNHKCFLNVKLWCRRISFTLGWLCVHSIWNNTFWCLNYFSFFYVMIRCSLYQTSHISKLLLGNCLNDVALTPKEFISYRFYWGVSMNIIQPIKVSSPLKVYNAVPNVYIYMQLPSLNSSDTRRHIDNCTTEMYAMLTRWLMWTDAAALYRLPAVPLVNSNATLQMQTHIIWTSPQFPYVFKWKCGLI